MNPVGPDPVDLALRRVLQSLSTVELAAVAAGRARVEIHPAGDGPVDPAQLGLYADVLIPAQSRSRRAVAAPAPRRAHDVDVAAAAAHIDALSSPEAVEQFLLDPQFTVPVLKQIARALGPTVLATGRTKSEVRRDIVAGTAGFRSRSAAMSGGAWA